MGKIAIVISFDQHRTLDGERLVAHIVRALRPIFAKKSRVEIQVTHAAVADAVLASAASYSGAADALQSLPRRKYKLSDYYKALKVSDADISGSR